MYNAKTLNQEKMAEVRSHRMRARDTLAYGATLDQTKKFKDWAKKQEDLYINELIKEGVIMEDTETKTPDVKTTETQVKSWHNEPASKSQLWYLHKLTRQDTRTWNMTKIQASELIEKHKANKGNNGATTVNIEDVAMCGAMECIATVTNQYKGEHLPSVIDAITTELNRFKATIPAVGSK